jgi:HCOMODA/2-hydroxy-3-carboxy-muconic semialdehyde decarboxylase
LTPITENAHDHAGLVQELVTANHILASENIVDAFGHLRRRDPSQPERFWMSRARAPALIDPDDIMEFDLSGAPVDPRGRRPYIERFIHAAIYAERPDVHSVVHDHSHCVIPFTVSSTPLRPIAHGGGGLGGPVPVWDIAEHFGDCTNMLVVNMAMGQDLAAKLGNRSAVLMRGHGAVVAAPTVRVATFLAIALDTHARLLREALQLGDVTYLSPGEVKTTGKIADSKVGADAIGRAWEHWCNKASRPFTAEGF